MLGFLAIPNLVRVVIIAGTAVIAFGTGWKINGWRLESRIASLQASHAKAYADSLEAMKTRENANRQAADKLRKDKDAEIKTVNRRLNAALDELRQRPARGVPDTAGTCPSATGDKLAREDAEFLTRYAAIAAEQQEFLKYCVRQYESLR